MNTKELLLNEFETRVFQESFERIYKCLGMINDADLNSSPNSSIPPITNLLLHLHGNASQWILSGLGPKIDNRDRDQEFVIQAKIRKSELVFLMESLKGNLRQTLHDLDPMCLKQKFMIQGFEVTGFSILIHVIEHFSYHTGQIALLTKWITNRETGFYGDIDLNQLNSLN